jgi:hypothetical protein
MQGELLEGGAMITYPTPHIMQVQWKSIQWTTVAL